MITVKAHDRRGMAPWNMVRIDVTYDPLLVEEFTLRDICFGPWDEIWGKKVDVEVDGKDYLLYLEFNSRTDDHCTKEFNLLKDA